MDGSCEVSDGPPVIQSPLRGVTHIEPQSQLVLAVEPSVLLQPLLQPEPHVQNLCSLLH